MQFLHKKFNTERKKWETCMQGGRHSSFLLQRKYGAAVGEKTIRSGGEGCSRAFFLFFLFFFLFFFLLLHLLRERVRESDEGGRGCCCLAMRRRHADHRTVAVQAEEWPRGAWERKRTLEPRVGSPAMVNKGCGSFDGTHPFLASNFVGNVVNI